MVTHDALIKGSVSGSAPLDKLSFHGKIIGRAAADRRVPCFSQEKPRADYEPSNHPPRSRTKNSSPGSTRWRPSASRTRSTGATARRRSTTGSATRWSPRHVHQAQPEAAARLLPRPQPSERRRPRRGPHVHLLAEAKTTPGPTNNWMAPDKMKAILTPKFDGCDEGPHDVRHPVQHGPDRLAHRPHRRAAFRFALRRRQHADHDPHGRAGAQSARHDGDFVQVPALGRHAAQAGAGRCALAVQPRSEGQVHRPLPRGADDLELRLRLRRQRAVGQEVPRAAHRLGAWPATKAGSPSTC